MVCPKCLIEVRKTGDEGGRLVLVCRNQKCEDYGKVVRVLE